MTDKFVAKPMSDGHAEIVARHRAPAESATSAITAQRRSQDEVAASLRWFTLWQYIRKWWWIVAWLTLASAIGTAAYSILCATKLYQANAVLELVSGGEHAGLSSLFTAFRGGDLSSMPSMFTGGLGGQSAEQYIAILESYSFTTALINKYGLAPHLRHIIPRWYKPTPWRLYKVMNKRFDAEFDRKSNTIQLTYIDENPESARLVLESYIDGLREKLRLQEIQQATGALTSMKDEAARTSDQLLQNELYLLVAKQIERQKLAQVQADFAFVVIDPPMVPDKAYYPRPVLYCALAAVLGALFTSLVAAAVEKFGRLRVDFLEIEHERNVRRAEVENQSRTARGY